MLAKNAILYATHRVVCNPAVIVEGDNYLQDMQELLTPNGTAEDHAKELENMNNDGSWVVCKQDGVVVNPCGFSYDNVDWFYK